MIRQTIKSHKHISGILLWIMALFLIIFIFLGYINYKNKDNHHNLVSYVRIIDVQVLELIAQTKYFLFSRDEDVLFYINADKKRLYGHLKHLKLYGKKSNLDEINTLEENIFKLFSMIDNLLLLSKEKNDIVAKIRSNIKYIDELLDTKRNGFLLATSSNLESERDFFKFNLLLYELLRELDIYLRTNDTKVLSQINRSLTGFKNQKDNLYKASFNLEEKELYRKLMLHIENKNKDIYTVISVHKNKMIALNNMRNMTDIIGYQLKKKFDKILDIELNKSFLWTLWTLMIFIGFFIISLIYVLLSKKFLNQLSSLLEDGFGQLLGVAQQITDNEKIKNTSFKEEKNEFQHIGDSMIEMKNSLSKSNLTKNETETLLGNMGDFSFIIHSDDIISFPSSSLLDITGHDTSKPIDSSILGEYFCFSTLKSLIKHNIVQEIDWHLVGRDYHRYDISLSAIILSDTSLLVMGSKRINIEYSESILNSLILLDSYGKICDLSTSFSDIFEGKIDIERGMTFEDLCNQYTIDKKIDISKIKELAKDSKEIGLTLVPIVGGEKHHLFLNVYVLFSKSLKKPRYALVLEDITRGNVKEKHSLQLVNRDALTGLLSRASLFHDMGSLISSGRNKKINFTLFIISISRFQKINDIYGYSVGDKMLVHVSNILKTSFGTKQTIARLGGDEFAILYTENMSSNKITLHVSQLLKKLNAEVNISGHKIYPHIFIGIAMYPNDGHSVKELLREAQLALKNKR